MNTKEQIENLFKDSSEPEYIAIEIAKIIFNDLEKLYRGEELLYGDFQDYREDVMTQLEK